MDAKTLWAGADTAQIFNKIEAKALMAWGDIAQILNKMEAKTFRAWRGYSTNFQQNGR